MREWTFWEWIGYASLGISALFVAIKTGVDSLPPSVHIPAFFNGALFGFLPIILFVIGSVVLILRAFGLLGKPHSAVPTTIPPPPLWPSDYGPTESSPKLAGSKHFVEVTPTFLMSLYDGHTDVMGQGLVEPYLGKWIRVVGLLEDARRPMYPPDIGRPLGLYTMTLSLDRVSKDDDSGVGKVILDFEEKWFDKIKLIRKGQKVSVAGKVDRVDRYTVGLKTCELLN